MREAGLVLDVEIVERKARKRGAPRSFIPPGASAGKVRASAAL
jgi:hypothetical protein